MNPILGFAMCRHHIKSISVNSVLAGRKFINSDTWNSHEKGSFNKQRVQVGSTFRARVSAHNYYYYYYY